MGRAIPRPRSFIICHEKDGDSDGKKLLLTRSCEAALRQVHLVNDVRILWIDSVCIDQTSIHERNHQVGIIGDVYAFAERVLVWLGEDPTLDASVPFNGFGNFVQKDHRNIDDRRRLESRMEEILEGEESLHIRLYSALRLPKHLSKTLSMADCTAGALWAKSLVVPSSHAFGRCKKLL
jgi:hypothetical protein